MANNFVSMKAHLMRRGKRSIPGAIYVALLLVQGSPSDMEKLRTELWRQRPKERDGRYAVVDGRLLHLCGWTTCQVTANTINLAMDGLRSESGIASQLRDWPYDVSGWPAVPLSDAPSLWHVSPDQLGEIANARP